MQKRGATTCPCSPYAIYTSRFDINGCVAMNPAWTNHCLCTCCHKTDLPRSKCIIFKESRYNFTKTTVIEALSTRFSVPISQDFICKQCDVALIAEKMPIYAVTAHTRPTTANQQKCVSCGTVCVDKMHHFDSTYGKNSLVTTIAQNQVSQKDNIICNKCHNAISKESIVTCLNCRTQFPRRQHIYFMRKNILLKYVQQNNQIAAKLLDSTYAKIAT